MCRHVNLTPLQPSFGMTGHTSQGQSAGPADKNQPQNAVDVITADPGTRSFEGNNPGTIYMLASRATTMGSGNLDSALYFSGPNMNRSRVLDIKYQKSSYGQREKKMYKKVGLREKWVAHLESKTERPVYTKTETEDLVKWSSQFRIEIGQLDEALSRRNWRTNMKDGVDY